MPYIAIKAYPKDEATKQKLVERINKVLIEVWGCPPEAVTISLEEIPKEEWKTRVLEPEIEKKAEFMRIRSGKRMK